MPEGTIRAAATTLLVREHGALEVLMVKRNKEIDFFSGAMMFPGGKVEPQDLDPRWAELARGWRDVADEERGPRIAAIREAFEECGVIAAADGFALGSGEAAQARGRIESGEQSFVDFLAARDIRVDLSRLTLFSRWLTPPVTPKRFDTFFYLVAAPANQCVAQDGREIVETEWVAPGEALRRAAAGERTILFPTRLNLRQLAESSTLAAAVESAGRRPPRQVTPQIESRDGERFLRLAPEDGYGDVVEPMERAPAGRAPNAPSR